MSYIIPAAVLGGGGGGRGGGGSAARSRVTNLFLVLYIKASVMDFLRAFWQGVPRTFGHDCSLKQGLDLAWKGENLRVWSEIAC